MLFWILACLALYLVNIYLSIMIHLPALGLVNSLGGRDNQPERGSLAGRAERALVNLKENLPIFLTLAVLSFVLPEVDQGQAVLGATVFVLARVAYLPTYLAGIPGLRTVLYAVSMVGLLMMLLALL